MQEAYCGHGIEHGKFCSDCGFARARTDNGLRRRLIDELDRLDASHPMTAFDEGKSFAYRTIRHIVESPE